MKKPIKQQLILNILVFSFLIIISGCGNDNQHISLMNQVRKVDISSWDNYSQTEFKQSLTQSEENGYNQSQYEKMALICLTHGELDASQQLLSQLSKKTSIADYYYYLAEIALIQERYEVAHGLIINGLAKASKKDKTLFYLLRVQMLISLGEFNKAQITLKKIAVIDKSNIHAQYLQAQLHLFNRDCTNAINGFEKLIKKLPSYTQFFSPLASAYRMCGKPEMAKRFTQHHTEGLLAFPNHFSNRKENIGNPVSFLKNDIKALISQKEFMSATKLLLHLIKLQPNNDSTYVNLGSMYFQTKNYIKAESAYTQALRINPKNIKALSNLGTVNVIKRNYKDAEKYFKKINDIQPFHLKSTLNLASISIQNNRPNEAEILLVGLLDEHPSNLSAKKALIISLIMQNKFELALVQINKWLVEEPTSEVILQLKLKLFLQNFSFDSINLDTIKNQLINTVKNNKPLIILYVLLNVKLNKVSTYKQAIDLYGTLTRHKMFPEERNKMKSEIVELNTNGYLGIEIFNE